MGNWLKPRSIFFPAAVFIWLLSKWLSSYNFVWNIRVQTGLLDKLVSFLPYFWAVWMIFSLQMLRFPILSSQFLFMHNFLSVRYFTFLGKAWLWGSYLSLLNIEWNQFVRKCHEEVFKWTDYWSFIIYIYLYIQWITLFYGTTYNITTIPNLLDSLKETKVWIRS